MTSTLVDDKVRVIWGALRDVGRPALLEWAASNSCVAASRLAYEVFGFFGVPVKPYKVTLLVANAKWVELLEKEQIRLEEPLPVDALEQGAYGLGVGYPDAKHPTGGLHVVVGTARYLMDLSLDQINVPKYNMVLRPLMLEVLERRFWQGKAPLLHAEKDCLLVYHSFPKDRRFYDAPDWKDFPKKYSQVAAKVIREVQGR